VPPKDGAACAGRIRRLSSRGNTPVWCKACRRAPQMPTGATCSVPDQGRAEFTASSENSRGLASRKTLRVELIPATSTRTRDCAAAAHRGQSAVASSDDLAVLLPALGRVLSRGAACRTTLDWLPVNRHPIPFASFHAAGMGLA